MFLSQTVTLAPAAAAYATGDRLGSKLFCLNELNVGAPGLLIESITVAWKGSSKPAINLHFLKGLPEAPPADNAAVAFSDDDTELHAGVVAVGAPSTGKIVTVNNVGMMVPVDPLSGSLYLLIELAGSGLTFAASEEAFITLNVVV